MPKITQLGGGRGRWQIQAPRSRALFIVTSTPEGISMKGEMRSLNRTLRGNREAREAGEKKRLSHLQPPIHSHGEGCLACFQGRPLQGIGRPRIVTRALSLPYRCIGKAPYMSRACN